LRASLTAQRPITKYGKKKETTTITTTKMGEKGKDVPVRGHEGPSGCE
jgi:hypothetical protein